jgi:hypothetical protein
MSKRPKSADELSRGELEAIREGGDIPLVDDDETLRAAGIDPETREPFPSPEEQRRRILREEEIEDAEAMSPEEHHQAKYGMGDA